MCGCHAWVQCYHPFILPIIHHHQPPNPNDLIINTTHIMTTELSPSWFEWEPNTKVSLGWDDIILAADMDPSVCGSLGLDACTMQATCAQSPTQVKVVSSTMSALSGGAAQHSQQNDTDDCMEELARFFTVWKTSDRTSMPVVVVCTMSGCIMPMFTSQNENSAVGGMFYSEFLKSMEGHRDLLTLRNSLGDTKDPREYVCAFIVMAVNNISKWQRFPDTLPKHLGLPENSVMEDQ